MEKSIIIFTIFTYFLFTISTASIALTPISVLSDDVSKPSTTANNRLPESIDLPIEKPESELDQTTGKNQLPESETTQTFEVNTIDSIPRVRFSRSNQINRQFTDRNSQFPLRFVRRHPCRKFQRSLAMPRMQRSYGNDMILSDKTVSVDLETIGDQVPVEWLEFKHKYGHRLHHHHRHHHDNDEDFEVKLDGYSGHRKREHKGGFMRRIRKFLKHTFD